MKKGANLSFLADSTSVSGNMEIAGGLTVGGTDVVAAIDNIANALNGLQGNWQLQIDSLSAQIFSLSEQISSLQG